MNTVLYLLMIIVPAVVLFFSAANTFKRRMQGKSAMKAMRVNLATFLVLIVMTSLCAFGVSAANDEVSYDVNNPDAVQVTAQAEEAAEEAEEAVTETSGASKGMGLLAAGLVTGLAGIGGGIAVAAGAPAAIAATSEDPKSFGKSLIFVALGESIALYGVVISILILNKV